MSTNKLALALGLLTLVACEPQDLSSSKTAAESSDSGYIVRDDVIEISSCDAVKLAKQHAESCMYINNSNSNSPDQIFCEIDNDSQEAIALKASLQSELNKQFGMMDDATMGITPRVQVNSMGHQLGEEFYEGLFIWIVDSNHITMTVDECE
jgi:hypothetical protein